MKLRSMIFVVGTLVVAGVGFRLATPVPGTRSMAELRDAGILGGQRTIIKRSEVTTPQTRRRINAAQPGVLRPKQVYVQVARVSVCFGDKRIDGGWGNCIKPSDGTSLAPFIEEVFEFRYSQSDGGVEWSQMPAVPLTDGGWLNADLRNDGGIFARVGSIPRDPDIIIPSLRQDLAGVNLDAGNDADGGEDEVDDAKPVRFDEAELIRCSAFDAGDGSNFCGRLNRLALVSSPCMIPLCLGGDGGWDDNATVDCRFNGPYGESDGGPRWRGCNTGPSQYASGTACAPVECGTLAGDDLAEEWK